METDYKVKLEVFEGPLDLLLYLIKRDEIDIYDISLERITKQYFEYLQAFKGLNIDVAGEFVVRDRLLIFFEHVPFRARTKNANIFRAVAGPRQDQQEKREENGAGPRRFEIKHRRRKAFNTMLAEC